MNRSPRPTGVGLVGRALLTSALVAAAGALATASTLTPPLVSRTSRPSVTSAALPQQSPASQTPQPTSIVSTPGTPSSLRCTGLTLAKLDASARPAEGRLPCARGRYGADRAGRAVLSATCETVLAWLRQGLGLTSAESGSAMAPQCADAASPTSDEARPVACGALVISGKGSARVAKRCRFDTTTQLVIDPTGLKVLESTRGFVVVDDVGRVVELVP